ncbi:MAG: Uma2 family endonuclease [Gemmatimonadales bacterium]
MPEAGTLTAEQLLHVRMPGQRTELIRGVLAVREPPGYRHGRVTAKVANILTRYVEEQGLGHVLAGDTGFTLARGPDTVRAPDVAFVARERIPDPPPIGYAELAPDLVVEVLSTGDRPGEVLAKVGDWLNAGSRLVWVVDPGREQVRVYRADGSVAVVAAGGALEGEDVVPGFTCAPGAIF